MLQPRTALGTPLPGAVLSVRSASPSTPSLTCGFTVADPVQSARSPQDAVRLRLVMVCSCAGGLGRSSSSPDGPLDAQRVAILLCGCPRPRVIPVAYSSQALELGLCGQPAGSRFGIVTFCWPRSLMKAGSSTTPPTPLEEPCVWHHLRLRRRRSRRWLTSGRRRIGVRQRRR